MSKTSIFSKAISIAILISLVLASFPMSSVTAAGTNENLEQKWDQLVTNFDRQSRNHNTIHKSVDHWLRTHKKVSASEQAELEKHLSICNSAILSAGTIVSQHKGFDATGAITERASAIKSIDNLSYFLRQHVGSIKSLREHMKQYAED